MKTKVMVMQTKEIGEFVKRARKSQGLTQADLASVSNVSIRFLSDLENGKPSCELGLALKVMYMLGIKIELTPPAPRAS